MPTKNELNSEWAQRYNEVYHDWLAMRNVARRFMKRWRFTYETKYMPSDLMPGPAWVMTVGGVWYWEPALPGEKEAVDLLREFDLSMGGKG